MLRSFARFSAAAAGNAGGGVAKRTTGITGLDVVPNSREVLLSLYEKTLNDVKVWSILLVLRRCWSLPWLVAAVEMPRKDVAVSYIFALPLCC